MSSAPESQPEVDARADWARETAVIYVLGEIHSRRPLVDATGLAVGMSDDPEYVSRYNAEIHRLLAAEGLPGWAPGRRMPEREFAKGLVRFGLAFEQWKAASMKEQHLVEGCLSRWRSEHGTAPDRFVRLPESQLLLVGGTVRGGFRVDVLDLRSNTWIGTCE